MKKIFHKTVWYIYHEQYQLLNTSNPMENMNEKLTSNCSWYQRLLVLFTSA